MDIRRHNVETELKDVCYALRRKMHLTQRELAAMIGSTQTEISFIERGFVPLAEEKIVKIYQMAKSAGVRTKTGH
ncbi:MAG: helix-turn-helix transcriptional regulator [Lachnospiraceae bacterium]|nr:helix-turn-helix transcriptional regulator [Lachnospiraceae bacterium]